MDEKDKQDKPDLRSLAPRNPAIAVLSAVTLLIWISALESAGLTKHEALDHIARSLKGGDNDGYNSDDSDGQSGV